MSPVPIQPLVSGQPLDYDPSTLEIPQLPTVRRPDQSTLAMASRYRPDPTPNLDDLVTGIISQESGGRAGARGQKGEIGLAQVMPSTAAQYGIGPEALAHPEVNKMVAKRYLGDLLRKYHGNTQLALAAYNAGPGNVDKGHIPQSTHDYVSRVLAKAGGGPAGFPSHPDESTLEIPSVYRPGARPAAFAQNMLFRPSDMGQLAGGAPSAGPAPQPTRHPVLGAIGRGVSALMGEGTAYAGEQPQTKRTPLDNLQKLPEFQMKSPEARQRMVAEFQKKSPEVQQQIIALVQARKTKAQPPTEEQQTDIAHPYYAKFRKPATELTTRGLEKIGVPKDWAQWGAENFIVPQTPTQAAIQTALMLSGLGETKLAAPLLEKAGLGGLETGLEFAAKTLPRRIGTTALAGALGSKAGGGGLGEGATQGAITQGLGEALRFPVGVVGRVIGKGGTLSKVEAGVADEITTHLPVKVPAGELDELGRGTYVNKVSDALKGQSKEIYDTTRGMKFRMADLNKSGSVVGERMMSLQEAEEELSKLNEVGYARGGPKANLKARAAREASTQYRDAIRDRLNDIRPGMGGDWAGGRRQLATAQALKRVFDPKNNVIDTTTGRIDQPNLVNAIRKQWGDLVRNMGDANARELLSAATRGASDIPGAPIADIPGQAPHVGMRLPHGPHVSMPRTHRPVGNVPLWIYPPRAPLAQAMQPVGAGITQGLFRPEGQP